MPLEILILPMVLCPICLLTIAVFNVNKGKLKIWNASFETVFVNNSDKIYGCNVLKLEISYVK